MDLKEIAYSKYANLPLQDKINAIAKTFDFHTGKIVTKLCRGKCRGYTDVSIVFDDKEEFFIGHCLTPEAKTKRYQVDLINEKLKDYNPEIVNVLKNKAFDLIKKELEPKDNQVATEQGLFGYELVAVALCKEGLNLGSYYTVLEIQKENEQTLSIDPETRIHLEGNLDYAIKTDTMDKFLNRANGKFRLAGGISSNGENGKPIADYVFGNTGFSTKTSMYSLWKD